MRVWTSTPETFWWKRSSRWSARRNGRAPTVGLSPFGPQSPGTAQGYAVGGGLEWKASKVVSVLGTFDRFAQVGAEQVDVDVTRNIAAVRLVVTAL